MLDFYFLFRFHELFSLVHFISSFLCKIMKLFHSCFGKYFSNFENKSNFSDLFNRNLETLKKSNHSWLSYFKIKVDETPQNLMFHRIASFINYNCDKVIENIVDSNKLLYNRSANYTINSQIINEIEGFNISH